jgi:PadR family transcriptional regulator PadR
MVNNAQLRKGVLEYCVLRLIAKEPTYGYDLVMQLKQVGFADISESTLYPLLLRLEQQEKVTVERKPSPKGPSRKYYFITESGKEALLNFQQDWSRLCQLVEKIFQEE